MGKNFGWRSAFPNRVRMPEFLTGPPLPRNKIEHEALLAGREGAPSLLLQKRRNCVSIGDFPFHMSDSEQAPFFEPDEMPAEVPLPEPPPERSAAPAAAFPRPRRSRRDAPAFGEGATSVFADRIPPHSVEAEQGLLSAILLDGGGDILAECQTQKVVPETFFRTEHQLIYEAISALSNAGTGVDSITVLTKLAELGKLEAAGGPVYLRELENKVATTVHAPHWLEIVKEKYFRRKLIATSVQTVERAFSDGDDIRMILDRVEKAFFEIAGDNVQDSAESTDQTGPGGLTARTMEILRQMEKNRGAIHGVPTGFTTLDQMTFGFHPGQMIVVAARPGMGKTSIALNFIEAALFDRKREAAGTPPRTVLMFSLEMTREDLMLRLLASKSRVNLRNIQKGFAQQGDTQKLFEAKKDYEKRKLIIDDVGGQTIMEIRAKARRIHARTPLSLIVIDYLQLINGTDSRMPREQQIAEASRSIKAMAKEFGVPIIALAQLNRDSDKEDRKPRASDLRESGSIEQDADVIMLIDIKRGGQRKSPTEDEEERQRDVRERVLIIAKQRNGPTGDIPLYFHSNITRFETPATNISEPNY